MLKTNNIKASDERVVVSGYAVVPPASFMHTTEGLTPGFGSSVQPLTRRLKRFTCRAGEHAVTASQLAFNMAEIKPEDMGKRCGLYTNQAGQQHSDIDDYHAGFADSSTSSDSALAHLWSGKEVNPFLAIKALSNNLLGMISVHWSIRGDCSAFVRDQAGAAMALSEAVFNLRHGYIDVALVLTAGTDIDHFEIQHQQYGGERSVDCGAVALILQRENTCMTQPIAEIFDMKNGYGGNSKKLDSLGEASEKALKKYRPTFARIIDKQYYCNPDEPRWGGIIYSLSQIIHLAKQQQNTMPIKVHSHDKSGFDAQITVRVC
jgi:hypothetical protein